MQSLLLHAAYKALSHTPAIQFFEELKEAKKELDNSLEVSHTTSSLSSK